jgi:hypothetical protein
MSEIDDFFASLKPEKQKGIPAFNDYIQSNYGNAAELLPQEYNTAVDKYANTYAEQFAKQKLGVRPTRGGTAWDEAASEARNEFLEVVAKNAPKRKVDGALDIVANLGRTVASSLVGFPKSFTDLAGTDNAASEYLGGVQKSLQDAQTPTLKTEQNRNQLRKEYGTYIPRENSTFLEDVMGYANEGATFVKATSLNDFAGGAASLAPQIGLAMLTGGAANAAMKAGMLTQRGASIAQKTALVASGAAQGEGALKGDIADSVERKAIQQGFTKEQANAMGNKASEYGSIPVEQQFLASVLGGASALTGADKPFINGKSLNNSVSQGVAKRTGLGGLIEGTEEFGQGAQSRYTQNQANIALGLSADPVTTGIFGEGFAGAIIGAPLGAATNIKKQSGIFIGDIQASDAEMSKYAPARNKQIGKLVENAAATKDGLVNLANDTTALGDTARARRIAIKILEQENGTKSTDGGSNQSPKNDQIPDADTTGIEDTFDDDGKALLAEAERLAGFESKPSTTQPTGQNVQPKGLTEQDGKLNQEANDSQQSSEIRTGNTTANQSGKPTTDTAISDNATANTNTELSSTGTIAAFNPDETGNKPATEAPLRAIREIGNIGDVLNKQTATEWAQLHEIEYSNYIDSIGSPERMDAAKFISGTAENILAAAKEQGMALDAESDAIATKRLDYLAKNEPDYKTRTRQQLGDRRTTDGKRRTEVQYRADQAALEKATKNGKNQNATPETQQTNVQATNPMGSMVRTAEQVNATTTNNPNPSVAPSSIGAIPNGDSVSNTSAQSNAGSSAVVPSSAAAVRPTKEADLTRAKAVNVKTGRVLQNRNRQTPDSIAQMTAIAANPIFDKVADSREMATGAPVVFADADSLPSGVVLGRKSTVLDGKNNRYDVQYAAVEADSVLASNLTDGSVVAEYEAGKPDTVRPVAGNGRAAGIKQAYANGKATDYKTSLASEAGNLGLDANAVNAMRSPVLVRVMPQAQVTDDIGDLSNISQTSALSPVDQAKNDAKRLQLDSLEFDDNGVKIGSVIAWINTLPTSEASGLRSTGTVSRQAIDRLNAAIFYKAYGSDELVRLYAEATDAEAKNIITAAGNAAPLMSQLEGAGEYDIRGAVVEAVGIAVAAKRKGVPLKNYLQTVDFTESGEGVAVALEFADNARSAKAMSQKLMSLAQGAVDAVALVKSNNEQSGFFEVAQPKIRQELFGGLNNAEQAATITERNQQRAGNVDTGSNEQAAENVSNQGNNEQNGQERSATEAEALTLEPTTPEGDRANAARAANATALDAQQQAIAENQAQPLVQQTAPDQRTDNTGEMFGLEKAQAELDKANEGKAVEVNPNQGKMFSQSLTTTNPSNEIDEINAALKLNALISYVKNIYKNSDGIDKNQADKITAKSVDAIKKSDKFITEKMLFKAPIDPSRELKNADSLIAEGLLVEGVGSQIATRFQTHRFNNAGVTLIKRIRELNKKLADAKLQSKNTQLSQTEPTRNPSNPTAIRKAIEGIFSGMKDAWARISKSTEIINSDGITTAMIPMADKSRDTAQAFFLPSNVKGEKGIIYLIADRITKGQEVGVWLHEVFHKRGEELLGKENLKKLYDNVQSWKNRPEGSVERQIYEAAHKRARQAANGENQGENESDANFKTRQEATYSNEFLPYAIEEANNRGITPDASKGTITAAGWLAKVKSLFEGALRKLLGGVVGKIDLSANDLMAMAYGTAKLEYEGKTAGAQGSSNVQTVRDLIEQKRLVYHVSPLPKFDGTKESTLEAVADLYNMLSDKSENESISTEEFDSLKSQMRLLDKLERAIKQGKRAFGNVSGIDADSFYASTQPDYWKSMQEDELGIEYGNGGIYAIVTKQPVDETFVSSGMGQQAPEAEVKKNNVEKIVGPFATKKEANVAVNDWLQSSGAQGSGVIATSLTPFDGIEKAVTPLGNTKTVTVNGKEYSVFNSDGKPIHPTVEGVRNFVRWFGDSKVTDNGKAMSEGGKPINAGHFTDEDNNFNTFDKSTIGSANRFTTLDGFYFGKFKEGFTASNKRLIGGYLKISNPIIIDVGNSSMDSIDAQAAANGVLNDRGDAEMRSYLEDFEGMSEQEANQQIADWRNADGVILKNTKYDTHTEEYIAFNPSQIKSATGNSGDFNPANPDIRFSHAPSLAASQEIAKTGKLPNDTRSWQEWKDTLVTKLTDSTRPFAVWTGSLPDQGQAATMVQAVNLASGQEADFNKTVMDKFGSRVSAAIGAIVKAGKGDKKIEFDAAQRLAGDWMSATYASIANQNLLKKDMAALQEAVALASELSTEKAELETDKSIINKHIASGNTTLKTVDYIAMLQRRENRLNKQINKLTKDIDGNSLDVDERLEAELFDLEQQLEEAKSAQKEARESVSLRTNNADARRELLLIDREIAKLSKRTGNTKASLTHAKDVVIKRQAAIVDKRVIDPASQKLEIGLAGGYNNATAAKMIEVIEERIDRASLEKLAAIIYEMNDWKLKKDIDLGKVTKEMAAEFDKSGKYVPLTGDPRADESAADVFGTGSANQGKDRAMQGRTSSLAQNGIDASFEQIQKTARYHGWADFKDALHGMYEKSMAKHLADTVAYQKEQANPQNKRETLERRAERKTNEDLGISRSPETMQRPSDNVIIYRKNGEAWVYDLGNEAAINALRSANVEPVPALYRHVAMGTRFMARMVIQFMPGFAPVNALRDTWEKSENIRTRVVANYPNMDMDKVARTMLGYSLKSLTTLHKTIMPVVAQGTPAEAILKLDTNNADQKLMIEFLSDGGASTWGTFMAFDGKDLAEKLGKMHNLSTKAAETLDVWNNSWELISSFSAYKALRENGMDSKAASNMALEMMNFRKGGEIMKPIKALYMFAQPIATGGHQLIKTLATPRGKARYAAYVAAGFLLYGLLRAGEDDDELGVNRMDKRSNYELERGILIPYGDKGRAVSIAVAFGSVGLAWNHATNLGKMILGKQSAAETAMEMFVKAPFKTFAPIAPSESNILKDPGAWALQTFAPSIIKPLANIGLDRTSMGGALTNSRFARPEKANALEGRSNTPEEYKAVALAMSHAGMDMYPESVRELRSYLMGPFDVVTKALIDNPAKEARGKEQVSQFVNRWVKNQDRDELKQRLYFQHREELDKVSVKASIKSELNAKETAMLKLLEEVKKDEASARGKKAVATKQFNTTKNEAMRDAGYKVVEEMQGKIMLKTITRMNIIDGIKE